MKKLVITGKKSQKIKLQNDKNNKFLEASKLFRKRMDERGISLKELLRTSKKVRDEVADEQFPD